MHAHATISTEMNIWFTIVVSETCVWATESWWMGYLCWRHTAALASSHNCCRDICLSNSTCQLRKVDKISSFDGLLCCCTTNLCNHPFKSVYVSQNATWCRQSKKSCVWSENSIMIAAAGCSLLPLLTLSVLVIGVLYAYRRLRLRRRWKMITDIEEVTSSGVGASDGASPLIDCDWRAATRAETCCVGRRLGSYRILLTEKNMWTGGGWSVACSR